MLNQHVLQTKKNNIFKHTVLIAPGIDCSWLGILSETAKKNNIELDIVAISRDALFKCDNSLVLSSSLMLDEVPETAIPELLIIPEGVQCFMKLLVDPRVHHLILKTVMSDGHVAMSAGAGLMLPQLSPQYKIPSSQLVSQSNLRAADFAQQLFSR